MLLLCRLSRCIVARGYAARSWLWKVSKTSLRRSQSGYGRLGRLLVLLRHGLAHMDCVYPCSMQRLQRQECLRQEAKCEPSCSDLMLNYSLFDNSEWSAAYMYVFFSDAGAINEVTSTCVINPATDNDPHVIAVNDVLSSDDGDIPFRDTRTRRKSRYVDRSSREWRCIASAKIHIDK